MGTYGQRQSLFLWHGARCTGVEHSILNCSYDRTWSFYSQYNYIVRYSSHLAAAVICRGYLTDNVHVCGRGNVRLLNQTQSQVYKQGRVEICDNRKWVGICSNSWSSTVIALICQKILGRSPKGKFGLVLIVQHGSIIYILI